MARLLGAARIGRDAADLPRVLAGATAGAAAGTCLPALPQYPVVSTASAVSAVSAVLSSPSLLPQYPVYRLMMKRLPEGSKISVGAKECMVSERPPPERPPPQRPPPERRHPNAASQSPRAGVPVAGAFLTAESFPRVTVA